MATVGAVEADQGGGRCWRSRGRSWRSRTPCRRRRPLAFRQSASNVVAETEADHAAAAVRRCCSSRCRLTTEHGEPLAFTSKRACQWWACWRKPGDQPLGRLADESEHRC